MSILRPPRALAAAALVLIAGCSGSSALPPASQGTSIADARALLSGSPFVHLGVPFAPVAARGRARGTRMHGNYSTSASLVFEGDQGLAATNVYQTSALSRNPAPIASLKASAGCPYGVVADKSGTIYVADNCTGNDVEEFPKGSTTESVAITTGISNPLGLAMDKSGNLYVTNYPASITVYPLGGTSPSQTITGGGMIDPFGIALDKNGNIFVADFGAAQVFEIPHGTTNVTPLNLQSITEPLGVAINEKTGDLWVTDGSGARVNVYPAGSTSPSHTITGFGFPYAIAFQNHGKPKGTVVVSDLSPDSVQVFKKGQYTPYATVTNGMSIPTGLLITKP